MKKYLATKIENIFTRGLRNNHDQVLKKMVSTSSYNYLMNNLSGGMVLPYNIWSISPPAMMVIVNHILINNVKTIVEFGTGVSTIFLNNLSIKNNLNLKIISVDHDLNWQNIIKEKYKVDGVEFIHAPLASVMKFKGNEYNWYDVSKLNAINKSEVDFIIIDGPIGTQSPYERAGAMEFFINEKNRANFSCFLDDINQGVLKDVMSYYFPYAKFYSEFGIAGSGLLYEIDPVLFIK
jgi:hypothetical protein